MEETIENIVMMCVKKYEALSKTGKPTKDEWTIVAAIVEDMGGTRRVVSMGTGSKCVGINGLSPSGSILHDSHAEVMARRGFLFYLMSEIESCLSGNAHLFFKNQDGRFNFKDNIKFWFVCSAVPCGDAGIIPKNISVENEKRKSDIELECPALKKQKLIEDIHRTGAKCVPNALQDGRGSGPNYHVTGQVRTKPGRGDPTASVSCSDKLARWNAVGVQGALFSLLIPRPIFFTGLIIAGKSPFSEVTLERAINTRIGCHGKMSFFHSNTSFGVEKSETRKRPAPSSIFYCLPDDTTQVAVEGRRLGTTKAKSHQSALLISKNSIFKKFSNILEKCKILPNDLIGVDFKHKTYREMKDLSLEYQRDWTQFKKDCFKAWAVKSISLENFTVADC